MLEKLSFGSPQRILASALLVLTVMAFASTTSARNGEPVEVPLPEEIQDVDITPTTGSSSSTTTEGNSTGPCEAPEQWLFAETYDEGELTRHGGKVWRAVEKNKGDMPGMNTPPSWEHVENHCSAVN